METSYFSTADLESILASAKILESPLATTPLQGGANNRVFRLDFSNRDPLILKSYFQHPNDPRPRLKVEFEFLTFAWKQGVRTIPEPLHQDAQKNMALYTFVKAAPATSAHSNLAFVEAATQFILELNRNSKEGLHLPDASEACSCMNDYFHAVEIRLHRLQNVPCDSLLHEQLHQFLNTNLIPKWKNLRSSLSSYAIEALEPEAGDRILTPSDFGLHNVLVSSDNNYTFIDFEYAGWDDPAKTICDFFLQPKIPVSQDYFDVFAKSIATLTRDSKQVWERAKFLLPICKIKWCCMILNIFVSTDKSRRRFANGDLRAARKVQLDLAKRYIEIT